MNCNTIGLAFSLALVGGCAGTKEVAVAIERPTAVESRPTKDVFPRSAQSLVRIETPHRFGGGFVARADGVIATSYSLLVEELTARVVLPDGTMFTVDRVLAAAPERDLALVSIAAQGLPAIELASGGPPTAGERVFVVGHALGMAGPSLAEGVVGSIPSAPGNHEFEIATALPAGFFGAQVLDASGHVLGIVGVERPNGATVLGAASIAQMLERAKPGAGETMDAFGRRTRTEDGWEEIVVLDPRVLDSCSSESRERVWGEVETAIENAGPIFEIGAQEASFRILEGAVFYLARELPDCKELLDVLLTVAADGRKREGTTDSASRLAEMLHSALELLFARSHALPDHAVRR